MAGFTGLLSVHSSLPAPMVATRLREMAAQIPGGSLSEPAIDLELPHGFGVAVSGMPDAGDTARLTALVSSPSGRFIIALTGALSPFTALRAELACSAERGAALIATAIDELGIDRTIQFIDSPLALAVWDRHEHLLTLGRDRHGQEVVFAGWAGSTLLFGTHLFALAAHPEFRRDIDHGALAQYLRYAHALTPTTIFRGVVRLAPGATITIDPGKPSAPLQQSLAASVREDARFGITHPFHGSADCAADALEAAVATAIRSATADPGEPLALLFSGGLDSTLIAAVGASRRERPIIAVTAGFSETAYDESARAREIATRLGLEHHVIPVTAADARTLLEEVPGIFQEPFGDLAALPAIKLARVARGFSTIAATGDGGDGMLEGDSTKPLWDLRTRMEGPLQLIAAHSLDAAAAGAHRSLPLISRYAPEKVARYLRPTRLQKAAAVFHATTPELGRRVFHSETLDPASFLIDPGFEPRSYYDDPTQWLDVRDHLERWRYVRVRGTVIDREIAKHSRVVTGAGLAYRALLMHPELTRLAWSLPSELRHLNGESRGLVRSVIARSVPREVFEHKKAGFSVPFDRWLRGPLRDIGEELLHPRRLDQQGMFNSAMVRREWEQHQTGKYDRRYILSDLIAFQLWYDALSKVSIAK